VTAGRQQQMEAMAVDGRRWLGIKSDGRRWLGNKLFWLCLLSRVYFPVAGGSILVLAPISPEPLSFFRWEKQMKHVVKLTFHLFFY